MATLFTEQAYEYVQTRPSYPPELFQFIASKTPSGDLAWDVGTGSGQAAVSLAEMYKNVIATDTSKQQLEFATKLSNVHYKHTSPTMSISEVENYVAQKSTVDLVIVAQALHWFDLTTFYEQVNWVLKKPHGVIAAWCYTVPEVDDDVDAVFHVLYEKSAPYWDSARKHVDNKYKSLSFPFEPVEGLDHTGPFEFIAKRSMDLEMYLTYIRSWSAYQTARSKEIELLNREVIGELKRAWGGNGSTKKDVNFPIYLMMGRVGNK